MKTGSFSRKFFRSVVIIILLFSACTLPATKRKAKSLGTLPPEPARTSRFEHGGFIIARGSIHNHTNYSDGCHTPEDLLTLARSQGIAVLAMTDHHGGKMCYGTYFCGMRGGVADQGYDVYYDHLREVQKTAKQEDMILLKGIEVTGPWVRNHGKFPNLVLKGGVHHYIVYNIEDTKVFDEMPIRYNVPFKQELDYTMQPEVDVIKYFNDRGGLVTCAHPEWAPDSWEGPVHNLNIPPHENILLPGLAAWAPIPESYEIVARPGSWWDIALAEYLIGMRDKPLWAEGDADYHCDHDLAIGTTMFYLKEFTEQDIYQAIRDGRMVALMGPSFQDTYVAQWSVSEGDAPRDAIMLGQEVTLDKAPVIRFALNHPVPGVTTTLIRNGVKLMDFPGTEFEYIDHDQAATRAPAFYRVEVSSPSRSDELFANPIFVRFKAE